MVEAHDAGAAGGVDYGEADRVGVGDGLVGEAFEPDPGGAVMLGAGEDDREHGAGLEAVERPRGGANAGAVEQEPVSLGEHQIGREQSNPASGRRAKHRVGFGVVLILSADERDPGAAIDEQPSGRGGALCGTARAFRQRTSP